MRPLTEIKITVNSSKDILDEEKIRIENDRPLSDLYLTLQFLREEYPPLTSDLNTAEERVRTAIFNKQVEVLGENPIGDRAVVRRVLRQTYQVAKDMGFGQLERRVVEQAPTLLRRYRTIPKPR